MGLCFRIVEKYNLLHLHIHTFTSDMLWSRRRNCLQLYFGLTCHHYSCFDTGDSRMTSPMSSCFSSPPPTPSMPAPPPVAPLSLSNPTRQWSNQEWKWDPSFGAGSFWIVAEEAETRKLTGTGEVGSPCGKAWQSPILMLRNLKGLFHVHEIWCLLEFSTLQYF